MFEVVSFVFDSIIRFVNSLRNVKISGTSLSLFSYFVGVMVLTMVVSFVISFFKIRKNIFSRKIHKVKKGKGD